MRKQWPTIHDVGDGDNGAARTVGKGAPRSVASDGNGGADTPTRSGTRQATPMLHLLASIVILLLLGNAAPAAAAGPRASQKVGAVRRTTDDGHQGSASDLALRRRSHDQSRRDYSSAYNYEERQRATGRLSASPLLASDAPFANSIDDLVLGDIVVVSSLEGGIYGLDRRSGNTRWTLPPSIPAGQRTTSSFAEASSDGAWSDAAVTVENTSSRLALGPLIAQGYGPNKLSYSDLVADLPLHQRPTSENGRDPERVLPGSVSGREALDALQELGMYVVEPTSGQLYMLTGSHADDKHETKLSKLPLTLPQLVDLSPFSFPGDASRVFVGHKRTSLVELDVNSGKLGTVFGGSGAGGDSSDVWCSADEPFQAFQEEKQTFAQHDHCDAGTDPAQQWTYMGRTDYTLTIHLRGRPSLSQTLSFSTFTPNAADRDVADLWLRRGSSADKRALMSMPEEGSIICFNSSQPGAGMLSGRSERTLWTNELGVTVAGIFDVAYQIENLGGETSAKPMLLPHPPTSLRSLFSNRPESLQQGQDADRSSIDSIIDRHATYLGISGGHLYAMGHEHFPLSAFTSRAPAALDPSPPTEGHNIHRDTQESQHAGSKPSQCVSQSCLLGSYDSDYDESSRTRESLLGLGPGQTPLLGIGDGRSDPFQRLGGLESDASIPTKAATSWTSPSMVMTQIIALFLLAILCGLVYLGGLELRRQRTAEANAITRDMVWAPYHASSQDSSRDKNEDEAKRADTTTLDRADVAVDTINANEEQPSADIPEKKKPTRRRKRGKRAGAVVAQREAKSDGGSNGANDDESDDGEGEAGQADGPGETNTAKMDDGAKDRGPLIAAGAVAPLSAEGGTVAPLANGEQVAIRGTDSSLIISDEVLGYGSSGTLVLRGEFQGRAVAVKRLLRDFTDVASKEVTLLQSADMHPNVIRYFYKEVTTSFLFIALELCPASLADIIEKPHSNQELSALLKPKRALRQIASGLHHLHSLSIVHRDIKPQNILVSPQDGQLKMLLSDFGLSKRLDGHAQTSFSQTMNNPGGTVGWRAPEILRGDVNLDAGAESNSTNGSTSHADGGEASEIAKHRLTRAVDIFALGCLSYYVLSNGEHPFGSRFEREMNILRRQIDLSRLDGLGEEGHEAQHMIELMVRHDPKQRPTAQSVLSHPYFWDAGRRLAFLQDASDCFDSMERDPPAPPLVALEEGAAAALGGTDWHKRIDRQVMEDLNKRRRYDPKSVAALLRAIRNKKHHIHDCPPSVRRLFVQAGGAGHDASSKLLPDGFLAYFTQRFPKLFLHVYEVVDRLDVLRMEPAFAPYFAPSREVI